MPFDFKKEYKEYLYFIFKSDAGKDLLIFENWEMMK